jgi:hypothetical protein
MDENITQQLLDFENEHIWINENLPTLLGQYAGQWIAVKGGRVIANDPNLLNLISHLPDPAHTCIEFVTRDPLEMVL